VIKIFLGCASLAATLIVAIDGNLVTTILYFLSGVSVLIFGMESQASRGKTVVTSGGRSRNCRNL
jgi:hypothetical protein